MTREETKKLLMVVSASYPNFRPQDISRTVDVWHMMMADYGYEEMAAALKTYIATDTGGFAPSIGQLIGKLQAIASPQELNEMEAWALVSSALRNGYYGAEEEYEKLPPMVQKAVGTPGQLRNWSQTDMESVENVIQSNFMRTYRSVLKREQETMRVPKDVKQMIAETGKRMLQDRRQEDI